MQQRHSKCAIHQAGLSATVELAHPQLCEGHLARRELQLAALLSSSPEHFCQDIDEWRCSIVLLSLHPVACICGQDRRPLMENFPTDNSSDYKKCSGQHVAAQYQGFACTQGFQQHRTFHQALICVLIVLLHCSFDALGNRRPHQLGH